MSKPTVREFSEYLGNHAPPRHGQAMSRPRVVFDHLLGEPDQRQVRRLSEAARILYASAWWRRVPKRDEPPAVAGETGTASQ